MQQQRHLVAILFTDIVGYTAMMQKDEQQAVAVIRQYHLVLERSVAANEGEVLNNYGDGSLCTFRSSVQAVNCALEIQQQLLYSTPPVPLRIGLHIGEIFFENGKPLGDSVNIASRIQSLGQANTILFSKEIFDKIKNRPELKSVSLGFFEFKNVDQPMEVFALASDSLTIPEKEKMEGKLKPSRTKSRRWSLKKISVYILAVVLLASGFFIYSRLNKKSKFSGNEKSIAVLPFVNMSTDQENEYFSDGMTEEITTQLSKIAGLQVIARTSSMVYKNSKKSVKQIAGELGVLAILEGSVQKAGDKIRITAQLVDATTQEHIWADKYDRDFKDIFAIQSEVAEEIAHQLNVRLTKDEKRKIEKSPTTNPQAYAYYLQGSQLHDDFWRSRDTTFFESSRSLLQKAIALDPDYALAHAALADLYNTYTNNIKKDSVFLVLQQMEIQKALAIDSTLDYALSVKGSVEGTLGNRELSYQYFRKAVELNANDINSLWSLGFMLGSEYGLIDESEKIFDKAVKLDPLSANNLHFRGLCKFLLYGPDAALKDVETAVQLEPEFLTALDFLAQLYAIAGRLDAARQILNKSLRLRPNIADHWAPTLAVIYARLGNTQKAFELGSNDWVVLIELKKYQEAIKAMPLYHEKKNNQSTPYLTMKKMLEARQLEAIKDNTDFKRIYEANKKVYENNKKRFSVEGLIH